MAMFAGPQNPPPGEQKKPTIGSLFGKKAPAAKESPDLSVEINNLSRRLKIIEEHQTNLRRKVQMTEQNMLSGTRRMMGEIRTVNSEISELRQMLDKIEDKVLLVIKELKLCAKKADVDTLNKYVDLWSPVNFVTRNEVENIIRDILSERK